MAGSGTIVPKGPRVHNPPADPEATRRARMLHELFTIPLPPPPTNTRTYSTNTALGRIMRLRGISIVELAKLPGGPSVRQVSDALGERRGLSMEHKDAIAKGLGVERWLLD